jgi:hypothetical protein
VAWIIGREAQGQASEELGIPGSPFAAGGITCVKMKQLYTQQGGLKLIQARVTTASVGSVILAAPAIHTQAAQTLGQGRVIGRQRAAVAERAEILRGVEAKAGHSAPSASLARAAVGIGSPCAVGLGRILNDRDSVALSHSHDRWHIGESAKEVDWHNRSGSRRYGRRESLGIHRVRRRINIDQHRASAGLENSRYLVHTCISDRDHFRAGANAEGGEGQVKRLGTASHADTVGRAAVGSKLILESRHLATEDVPAALNHSCDSRIEIGAHRGILATQIAKGDSRRLHLVPH